MDGRDNLIRYATIGFIVGFGVGFFALALLVAIADAANPDLQEGCGLTWAEKREGGECR